MQGIALPDSSSQWNRYCFLYYFLIPMTHLHTHSHELLPSGPVLKVCCSVWMQEVVHRWWRRRSPSILCIPSFIPFARAVGWSVYSLFLPPIFWSGWVGGIILNENFPHLFPNIWVWDGEIVLSFIWCASAPTYQRASWLGFKLFLILLYLILFLILFLKLLSFKLFLILPALKFQHFHG